MISHREPTLGSGVHPCLSPDQDNIHKLKIYAVRDPLVTRREKPTIPVFLEGGENFQTCWGNQVVDPLELVEKSPPLF